jgi:hypothetical protein
MAIAFRSSYSFITIIIAYISAIYHFLTSGKPPRMAMIREVSPSYNNNKRNIHKYNVDIDSDYLNGAATTRRR